MKVELERKPWLDPSVDYLTYLPGLLGQVAAEKEIIAGLRPNPLEWRKSNFVWTQQRAAIALRADNIRPDEEDTIFDQRHKNHDTLAAIVIARDVVSRVVDVVSLNIRAIDVLIAADPPQKERAIVLPVLTDPSMHTPALRDLIACLP